VSFRPTEFAADLANISGADETATIAAWRAAFYTYERQCITDNGVSITASGAAHSTALDAFSAAMVGLSDLSTGGAPKIQAAIIAFWDYIANPSNIGFYFAGGSNMVKPSGLTGIQAAIEATYPGNLAIDVNLPIATQRSMACTNVANAIHGCHSGGTVRIGGVDRVIS